MLQPWSGTALSIGSLDNVILIYPCLNVQLFSGSLPFILRFPTPSPPATLIMRCTTLCTRFFPPLPVLDCLYTWTSVHYCWPPPPIPALAVLSPQTFGVFWQVPSSGRPFARLRETWASPLPGNHPAPPSSPRYQVMPQTFRNPPPPPSSCPLDPIPVSLGAPRCQSATENLAVMAGADRLSKPRDSSLRVLMFCVEFVVGEHYILCQNLLLL